MALRQPGNTERDELTVPAPESARHPQALVNPTELRAWLSSQPSLDSNGFARALLGQLHMLVRYPEPLPRYDSLLALYQPYIDDLLARLRQLVDAQQGKERAQRRLDQLAPILNQIAMENAFAYKRQVNRTLVSADTPLGGGLYGAMLALGRQLLLALIGYQRVPLNAWREMLQIYDLARVKGIESERQSTLEDGATDTADELPATPPTIEAALFHALLIQLADTYRLSPSDIWRLYDRLAPISDLVETVPLTQCSNGIRVDLGGRTSPSVNARDPAASRGGRQICINVDPLAERLGADERELLALPGWASTQRRAPRQDRAAAYQAYRGLMAIHDQLLRAATENQPRTLIQPDPDEELFSHMHLDCRQRNQSAGGAAFTTRHPARRDLRVGELLLLRARARPSDGQVVGFVGQVRRLMQRGNDELQFGVERLQGKLVPVRVRHQADRRLPAEALLRQVPGKGGLSLYTAPGLIVPNIEVELTGPRRRYRVRPLDVIESREGYQRVRVRLLDGEDGKVG